MNLLNNIWNNIFLGNKKTILNEIIKAICILTAVNYIILNIIEVYNLYTILFN